MPFKWKVMVVMRIQGKYLIWIEEEDDGTQTVYSTDSIFWRDFFKVVDKDDR